MLNFLHQQAKALIDLNGWLTVDSLSSHVLNANVHGDITRLPSPVCTIHIVVAYWIVLVSCGRANLEVGDVDVSLFGRHPVPLDVPSTITRRRLRSAATLLFLLTLLVDCGYKARRWTYSRRHCFPAAHCFATSFLIVLVPFILSGPYIVCAAWRSIIAVVSFTWTHTFQIVCLWSSRVHRCILNCTAG